MRIVPGNFLGFIFTIIDIPATYLILALSFYFRFYSDYISVSKGIPDFYNYSNTFWLISVMLYIFLSLSGQYQRGFKFTPENSWYLTRNIFIGFLATSSMAFFYRSQDYSRVTFLVALAFTLILLNLFYLLKDRLIQIFAPLSFKMNNIMIIGTGSRAIDIYNDLKKSEETLNLSMIGPPSIKIPSKLNYLGPIKEFKNVIKDYHINQVIIALPDSNIKQAMGIVQECENKRIKFAVVPDLFEIVTQQVTIGGIHGIPVMTVGSNLPIYGLQMKLKHVFDFLASLLSIIVLSPLCALVSLLIKMEDGGPIFYSQERVGKDGKTFQMYKFRSMRVDAETKSGPMWAIQGDPRWTRMGTILRKTSIDELPQLWNVLKGDMSLVGPRPERPVFVNEFKENIPGYMIRHKVRGGLTGWSQCNGLRGQTSLQDRTTYDLYYVENWSLIFDVRILFQTVFKMVFIQSGY